MAGPDQLTPLLAMGFIDTGDTATFPFQQVGFDNGPPWHDYAANLLIDYE